MKKVRVVLPPAQLFKQNLFYLENFEIDRSGWGGSGYYIAHSVPDQGAPNWGFVGDATIFGISFFGAN